nr:hypothetical protein Iba_chr13fCG9650 [Ipomoea batatas]
MGFHAAFINDGGMLVGGSVFSSVQVIEKRGFCHILFIPTLTVDSMILSPGFHSKGVRDILTSSLFIKNLHTIALQQALRESWLQIGLRRKLMIDIGKLAATSSRRVNILPGMKFLAVSPPSADSYRHADTVLRNRGRFQNVKDSMQEEAMPGVVPTYASKGDCKNWRMGGVIFVHWLGWDTRLGFTRPKMDRRLHAFVPSENPEPLRI